LVLAIIFSGCNAVHGVADKDCNSDIHSITVIPSPTDFERENLTAFRSTVVG
jgi:hypothetical protein